MGKKIKAQTKKGKKNKFSPLKASDFFHDIETPKKEEDEQKVGAAWVKKGDASSKFGDAKAVISDDASSKVDGLPSAKPIHAPNGNSFVGLFRGNRIRPKGVLMEYAKSDDGEVVLEMDDCVPIHDTWGYCLVGCFTGRFPGGKAVHDLTKSWGVACKVIPHTRHWTIFKFKTLEDRDKVFEGGPYVAYNKTLMLKKVDDGSLFNEDLFLDIPIWVQFWNVPLNFWNPKALGKIASKLGRPLYSDQVTRELTSAKYARILVEVDMRKEPVFEYEVKTPWGPFTQRVCYENCPEFCYHCKKFGHYWDKCGKHEANNEQVEKRNKDGILEGELSTLDSKIPNEKTIVSGVSQDVKNPPEPVLSLSDAVLPSSEGVDTQIASCETTPVLPEETAPTVLNSVDAQSTPTNAGLTGGVSTEVLVNSDDNIVGESSLFDHDMEAQIDAIIRDNSPDQDIDESDCEDDLEGSDDSDYSGSEEKASVDENQNLWMDEFTFERANAVRVEYGLEPWSCELFSEYHAYALSLSCDLFNVVTLDAFLPKET